MPPQQAGTIDWAAEADKVRGTAPTSSGVEPPPGPSTGQLDWSAVADDIRTGKTGAPFQADPSQLPFLQRPPATKGKPFITDPQLWSGLGNIAEIGSMIAAPEIFGPAKTAPILTRIVGRMFAAGAGGATARTARTIAQGQTDEGQPLTPKTVAGEAAGAFGQGFTGEAIAGGITGAKGVVKSGIQRVLAAPPSALGAEASQMLGGHVTPAQQSDRWGTAMIENAMKRSIFAGGRWVNYLREQGTLLNQKANAILAQFGGKVAPADVGQAYLSAQQQAEAQAGKRAGMVRDVLSGPPGPPPTPESAGQTWLKLQQAAHQAADETTRALYEEHVWPLAEREGTQVSLAPVSDYVSSTVAQRGEPAMALVRGPVKTAFRAVQAATEPPDDVASQARQYLQHTNVPVSAGGNPADQQSLMARLNDALKRAGVTETQTETGQIPLRQAKELRTQFGYHIPNDPTGDFSQLYKRLTQAIESATTDASGQRTEVGKAFWAATEQAKLTHETFEEGLLGKVADTEPRLIVDSLVKPNRVEELKQALEVVGPEGQQAISRAHMQSLLTGPTGAPATTAQLQQKIRKLSWDTITTLHGNQVRPLLEGLGTLQDEAAALKPTAETPYQAFAKIIKPGAVDEVQKAKTLLSPSDWQQVQRAKGQQILFNTDGSLKTGAEIVKATHDPAFEAAYPNGEGDGLMQFGRVTQYLQRPQPPGSVFLWAQGGLLLAIGGAVTGAATGTLSLQHAKQIGGSAAGLILAPTVITRVLLNPAARQWLTQGIQAQAAGDTGRAARLAGQVSAWVGREVYRSSAPTPPPAGPGPNVGAGGGPLGRSTPLGPPPIK